MTRRHYNIFRNPLFIKSCRARLRPADLTTWVVITLVMTGFVFMLIYFTSTERGNQPADVAAFNTLIPILVVQGIILMLAGTGAVASGFANEKDTGILDYHRLTPMSPMSKVTGYLFGLGVREYILFAITMPFMIIVIVVGGINPLKILHLYSLFFLAILLYHLTGIVSGIIAPKAQKASVLAQFIVMGLYLMTALRFAGLKAFEHLTVVPAIVGILRDELGSPGSAYSSTNDQRPTIVDSLIKDWEGGVSFFWFEQIDPTVFTIVLQGFLIVSFLTIIYRKWINVTAHPISKPHALIFFAAILFVFVGSLWPTIGQPINKKESGILGAIQSSLASSPTPGDGSAQSARNQIRNELNLMEDLTEDLFGRTETQRFSFGFVIFLLITTGMAVGLIHVITPEPHERIHAIERAKIFKKKYINPLSDAASNVYYGPFFFLCFAWAYFGLFYQAHEVTDLANFVISHANSNGLEVKDAWAALEIKPVKPVVLDSSNITSYTILLPLLSFGFMIIYLNGLREVFGLRIYFMFLFVWWLIPVFIWILLMSAFGAYPNMTEIGNYIATPSPLAIALYSAELFFSTSGGGIIQQNVEQLMLTSVVLNGILAGAMLYLQMMESAKLRKLFKTEITGDETDQLLAEKAG